MSEALAVIDVPMPPIRPKGVTPRQWRLAAIYPRAESAYAALIAAGYAHKTATQNAKSQLETVGVQRAMAVQSAAKRDSAAAIKSKSAARVLAEVERDGVDPMFALSAWTSASKVKAEYPDEENGIEAGERQAAAIYLRNVVRAVLVAAGHDITSDLYQRISNEVIDTAVLTLETE